MALPEVCRQYTAFSLMRLFDLTLLTESTTHGETVASACATCTGGLPVASTICVLPSEVKSVKASVLAQQQKLQATGQQQRVSVALNYPDGSKSTEEVCMEAVSALKDGAEEFDCLIDWKAMNRDVADGENRVRVLISEVKKVVSPRVVRAVLEVGKLSGGDIISRAGIAALQGGADFLQTSSGLEADQTTFFAVHLLSDVLDEYAKRAGQETQWNPLVQNAKKVGIKVDIGPNGSQLEATNYLLQIIFEKGIDFVQPNTFRIGGNVKLLKELKDVAAGYVPPDTTK